MITLTVSRRLCSAAGIAMRMTTKTTITKLMIKTMVLFVASPMSMLLAINFGAAQIKVDYKVEPWPKGEQASIAATIATRISKPSI